MEIYTTKVMKVTKIEHRGEVRIRLDFPYDSESIAKVKQIKGAIWSSTLKAWHIPYKKEAYSELCKRFDSIILPELPAKGQPSSGLPVREEKPEPGKAEVQYVGDVNKVKIEVIGKKILLSLKKNESDIKFINSIRYSRWNRNSYVWEVPNYPGNLDWIKDYFNGRISQLIIHESYTIEVNSVSRSLSNKDILIIKTPEFRTFLGLKNLNKRL